MSGAADVAGLVPPDYVQRAAAADEAWARRMTGFLAHTLDSWELHPDGVARAGRNAVVVPVRRADGTPAAVRLEPPRPRTRHDHLALRAWAGHGAVALLAADPATSIRLLERLDADTDLTTLPALEACEIVGRLLRRLDRPALPPLDTAHDHLDTLAPRLAEALRTRPVIPRRFVEHAAALARDLRHDDGTHRLTPTALGFDNVLAGDRGRPGGPWALTSPAALAAERAYGVWPVLRARWGRVGGDARWDIRTRLGVVCDAAGVDEDRARAWATVRTVAWVLHRPGPTDATRPGDDRMDVTDAVTLLKALQPGG